MLASGTASTFRGVVACGVDRCTDTASTLLAVSPMRSTSVEQGSASLALIDVAYESATFGPELASSGAMPVVAAKPVACTVSRDASTRALLCGKGLAVAENKSLGSGACDVNLFHQWR